MKRREGELAAAVQGESGRSEVVLSSSRSRSHFLSGLPVISQLLASLQGEVLPPVVVGVVRKQNKAKHLFDNTEGSIHPIGGELTATLHYSTYTASVWNL